MHDSTTVRAEVQLRSNSTQNENQHAAKQHGRQHPSRPVVLTSELIDSLLLVLL